VDEIEKRKNHTEVRGRAKMEWFFRIVKRVFRFTKVRYWGVKKITNDVGVLCVGQSLQKSQTAGEGQSTIGSARGVVCPLEFLIASCVRNQQNNPVYSLVL